METYNNWKSKLNDFVITSYVILGLDYPGFCEGEKSIKPKVSVGGIRVWKIEEER